MESHNAWIGATEKGGNLESWSWFQHQDLEACMDPKGAIPDACKEKKAMPLKVGQ